MNNQREKDRKKLIEFYKQILYMEAFLEEMDKRYPITQKFHETVERNKRELDKIRHEFIWEISEMDKYNKRIEDE